MWRTYLCDTMTGLLGAPVDIPAFSWSVSVSDSSFDTTADKGTGEGEASSVVLPWTSVPGSTPAQRGGEVAAGRRGLVMFWADSDEDDPGVPVLFGAIGDRDDTWADTTFGLESVMDILSERYCVRENVFGLSKQGHTSDVIKLSGLSKRGMACAIGSYCADAKPGGTLPIDWTYQGESGSSSMSLHGYDVRNLDGRSLLEGIASTDGGPDMQFRPYLDDGGRHVRLAFMAGSDADVYLGQKTVHCIAEYNDLHVSHAKPYSRVWCTGSGSEDEMWCYLAQDTSMQYAADPRPLFETAYSNSDAEDLATLQSYGDAQLAAKKVPLAQVTLTVDAHAFALGDAWPGETFIVPIYGFPTLPDGDYALRLMSMSGDEGNTISLTFDPIEDPTY